MPTTAGRPSVPAFFHKPPILWMVTAKHVVEKIGLHALTVLVTPSSGEGFIIVEVGKILGQHGLSWMLDADNDLAAAPMPASSDFGIKALTVENCVRLPDLVPSTPCFTVGCPYGLHGLNPQRTTPLVLDGVISGVDPANHRVYTSAATFPGNSGGPLITFRNPFGTAGIMGPAVFIAGIMLEIKLVHDPNPASRIPPLHLGVAAQADAVLTLLDSDNARAITDRVLAMRTG